ncbi:hypothetical protein COMNV_00845 [Commensalibacter sp. Nvir]|uniref:hypothetical protein n=1 Tax=Commensalibacter sp. Nvir TaxID=3069817 RepID=UPI002D748163|nr:hypothetical protein COMNV_00845 [Commensalibacter sp. Nvir]
MAKHIILSLMLLILPAIAHAQETGCKGVVLHNLFANGYTERLITPGTIITDLTSLYTDKKTNAMSLCASRSGCYPYTINYWDAQTHKTTSNIPAIALIDCHVGNISYEDVDVTIRRLLDP